MNAQLLTELARSCRLLASHQQNQNILDMLHDLEEDFAQKERILRAEIDLVDVGLGQPKEGDRFRPSPTSRSS
jgi:hypothetical protein